MSPIATKNGFAMYGNRRNRRTQANRASCRTGSANPRAKTNDDVADDNGDGDGDDGLDCDRSDGGDDAGDGDDVADGDDCGDYCHGHGGEGL